MFGIDMKKMCWILLLLWVCDGLATSGGGAWQIIRTRGFTSSMGTVSQNAFSRANAGAVLLAVNYFTIIDSVTTLDSVRTAGLGSAGNYLASDSRADTTVLYLDGYVGQFIQVAFFFDGVTANTLSPVSVWQGLSYNQTVQDEGAFLWGMIPVDTLFTDSLNAARTSMTVLASTVVTAGSFVVGTSYQIISLSGSTQLQWNAAAATSGVTYAVGSRFAAKAVGAGTGTAGVIGHRSRIYTDSFLLSAPAMFIQFANKSGSELENDIYIEIYARHKDAVMGGVSGRLEHRIEKQVKTPGGRRRVR